MRCNWSLSVRMCWSLVKAPTTAALQQATRTVPIVMAQGVDPVGAGFIKSLARPGGNTTGFTQFEFTLAAKWLELLKEIAPQVARVGVIREAIGQVGVAQWAVIGAAASPLGVELSPVDLHVAGDTERTVSEFARGPKDGLIVVVGTVATIQRELMVTLAARHRLPTIYAYRSHVVSGGLMSYAARPGTWIASSGVRNQPICRCRRLPSSSW